MVSPKPSADKRDYSRRCDDVSSQALRRRKPTNRLKQKPVVIVRMAQFYLARCATFSVSDSTCVTRNGFGRQLSHLRYFTFGSLVLPIAP
jgi:hypothetical protein